VKDYVTNVHNSPLAAVFRIKPVSWSANSDKCRPPLRIADFEGASGQLKQVGYYTFDADG